MIKRFLSWLNRKWGDKGVRQKIQIVKREASRFRLHDWKSNTSLVNLARKTLDNNDFRIMMDVVRNEHPLNQVTFEATVEDRAIVQARCEGYMLALNNLESLGTFEQIRELGPATFGAVPPPGYKEEEEI